MAHVIKVETTATLVDHDGRPLFSVTDSEDVPTFGQFANNGANAARAATRLADRIEEQFNTRYPATVPTRD